MEENKDIFKEDFDYIKVYVKTIFGFYIKHEKLYRGTYSGAEFIKIMRRYYDIKYTFDRNKYYFKRGWEERNF